MSNVICIILYALMVVEPARLKIVADPGGFWNFGSTAAAIISWTGCQKLSKKVVPKDRHEELEALHCWFHVDPPDREKANRRLYDYARGENVFAWR